MPNNYTLLSRRQALGAIGAARFAAPLQGFQRFFYGTDEPLPRQIALTAGPLTMVFEPELAFLRYLRLGQTEVIRGIYAAVRDRNWGTIAPRVTGLKIELREASFLASFDVECKQAPIDFLWRGEISGDREGNVRFRFSGQARSTFLRNRLGFCVLHPVRECAGKPCTVTHTGGSREEGKFPLWVSPHQPFKDMAAIRHEIAPGLFAESVFEGETFEMEDHRNWTDASYKTYCTPLDRPFPVEVKQGTRVEQSVTIRLEGKRPAPPKGFLIRRGGITLEPLAGQVRALPRFGVGLAAADAPPEPRELRRLAALRPAHLRVDYKSGDASVIERAILESKALAAPLEIALHLSDKAEEELRELGGYLTKHRARAARFLVYHQAEKSTGPKWVKLARERLSGAAPGAQFGGGANAYFAELNRGRPDPAALDFLCFSVNPQVHAFDNASLVENLEAQADALNSARQFSGGKPILATPVTFKPRFNPNATAAGADTDRFDPRQRSLFGAAWTTGSVKYIAQGGAQSVTYYETTGPGGLLESGVVFPLYHILADGIEFAGGEVTFSRSSSPLEVDGFMLRRGNRVRAVAANMTPEAQAVRLTFPSSARRLRVRRLDEHSLRSATESPETWRLQPGDVISPAAGVVSLALGPFAVATIDSLDQ
jgi:hypothetical protein